MDPSVTKNRIYLIEVLERVARELNIQNVANIISELKYDDPMYEYFDDVEHKVYKNHIMVITSLCKRFIERCKNADVPEPLPDGWSYGFILNEDGASLVIRGHGSNFSRIVEYPIIVEKPKFLSTQEFSDLYGVKPVTVRQWIRRGKIRHVRKEYWGWQISELAKVDPIRPKVRTYVWDEDFEGFPEATDSILKIENEVWRQCHSLTIKTKRGGTVLKFGTDFDDDSPKVYELEKADAEAFELALLTERRIHPPYTIFYKI